ncbi:MAG: hypothetical protein IJW45_02420, partial [Oscillospiraceae bacterium]|nr:hypothetical protein [Oscillospiraceae bacterium]
EGRTVDLGKVMAAMLDGCNIPFAIISGDTASRSSNPMYPDEPTQEGRNGIPFGDDLNYYTTGGSQREDTIGISWDSCLVIRRKRTAKRMDRA